MDIEKFCKDRAENLMWSQTMCADALGMSRWKFRLLLPHLNVKWPDKGKAWSSIEANRNRPYSLTPARERNLEQARRNRHEKYLVNVDGIRDTLENHSDRYQMSRSHYTRKVAALIKEGLTRQQAAEQVFGEAERCRRK